MVVQINYMGGSNMKHLFLQSPQEDTKKEQLFEILKNELKPYLVEENELKNIYDFACKAYNGIYRYSGDEYVTHTLNTAIILAQLGAEKDYILAGMLCDVLNKTEITEYKLRAAVPQNIADIVIMLKSDNLSSIDDVFVIKLAQRLHNLRTAKYVDQEKVKAKAKETVEMFVPYAAKLANDRLLCELNDLTLKYI